MSVGGFAPNRNVTEEPADLARPDQTIQQALLAALVESSDDAIVSKTLEGRILSWNVGATRIFGFAPEEAIGRPITLIIPPELHAEEQRILAKLKRGERIDHFDTTRMTKDGRRIPISLTVSPIRDARGVIIGASKVARDISERRRAEQLVRERAEALREADRRKDEFLALLAHELRNPLAPIRYVLAASRKAGTPEQHRRAEEVIERQVAHLSRLLDDLLDISRVTRGTLELKKSPTELTYIVGSAIETARPLLDAKRHELSLDLPKHALRLEADAVRLAQVFSNLLINAAKYTDPGGHILLRAAQEANEVVVAVRDDGIGIAAELMPRLFTLYSQGRAAHARAEGGLGVGLALVRGLVRLHGGSVSARSDGPGCGSEFVVRLPIGAAAEQPAAAVSEVRDSAPGAGLKVLVVDDSRDVADTCATLLELSGHYVQTAYAGREALELAETFRPHVLLLDIGLPDTDGYQVAQKIRAADWGRDVQLVAVTAWGQAHDRQRAFEAGFDQHLTKPLAAEALEALLHSLRRSGRAARAAAGSARAG
jgi:two-component system, chemotaxis family, CheB/CheR fusion protein